jgi:hypothetical protein
MGTPEKRETSTVLHRMGTLVGTQPTYTAASTAQGSPRQYILYDPVITSPTGIRETQIGSCSEVPWRRGKKSGELRDKSEIYNSRDESLEGNKVPLRTSQVL